MVVGESAALPPVALFCSREYVRSSAEGEAGEGSRREETRGKQSARSGPVELGQWLSGFRAQQQHLDDKDGLLPRGSDSAGLGLGLRSCISKKPPGDTDATHLGTTFREPQ